MTTSAEESLRMRRARTLQRSEGVALGAAVVSGGIAALSWLAVVLLLASAGEGDPLTRAFLLWLAIAVAATAACSAFAAARLVLLGLARSEGAEL